MIRLRVLAAGLVSAALLIGLLVAVPLGPARSATAPAPAKPGAPPAARPEVLRGKALYGQYCATCHGVEGKGDGAGGANLPIRPQDLTDGRVLNPLPDHFLFRVIAEGGQSVGLSPLMPNFRPYPLNEIQIKDLIAFIRTLAQPPFDPRAVLPVPTRREGPVQPIFFSHVIHAGSFGIACQYCHADARRSSTAGLPSVERCMGCHKIVSAQGNPEVDKLRGYFERGEPIPWVRVFKVPEHAQFTHKAHVRAGLQCQTCHGRVEAMERVTAGGPTVQSIPNDILNLLGAPVPPVRLSMGWCVECHRLVNDRGVAAVQRMADVPVPSVKAAPGGETERRRAPLECVNCHH